MNPQPIEVSMHCSPAVYAQAAGFRVGLQPEGANDRVAIRVILAVDRVRGCRDLRLIERYGNDFVAPEVSDVADLNGEVVAGLPLNIQDLIESIGKLILPIVIRECEQRRSAPRWRPRWAE